MQWDHELEVLLSQLVSQLIVRNRVRLLNLANFLEFCVEVLRQERWRDQLKTVLFCSLARQTSSRTDKTRARPWAPRANRMLLWRQHCWRDQFFSNVDSFCHARNICGGHKKCFWKSSETFVRAACNIVAAFCHGRATSQDTGHKKCFWRFSETFFCPGHKICPPSQHLGNMITSAMLPPQGVLVLPGPEAQMAFCTGYRSPFHSQEWSTSNFPSSFTRNITSHRIKNLAVHSSRRWNWCINCALIRVMDVVKETNVSSVSPSSERIRPFAHHLLWWSADARNVSYYLFHGVHHPHQQTVDTPVCLPPRRRCQSGSLSWLYATQMKEDCTINSHDLTYTFVIYTFGSERLSLVTGGRVVGPTKTPKPFNPFLTLNLSLIFCRCFSFN